MYAAAAAAQKQELSHLLDPTYYLPARPTSALSQRSYDSSSVVAAPSGVDMWTDAQGAKHDPDFRPFVVTAAAAPRRASDPAPPRKNSSIYNYTYTYAAPSPSRAAPSYDSAPAKQGWWTRKRGQSVPAFAEYDYDEDADADDEEEEEASDESAGAECAQDVVRRRLASLTLKVDLAVFRAKKRIRSRLGV